jgi:Na+/H+ antiporter NhaB
MMYLARTVFTIVLMLATSVVGYSQAHAIGHVFAEVVETVSLSAGSNMKSMVNVSQNQPAFSAGDFVVSGSECLITPIFLDAQSLEAGDGSMVSFHHDVASLTSISDGLISISGSIDPSAFEKEVRAYTFRYQMILAYN